jgi:integral membrane sensor domain MASE1
MTEAFGARWRAWMTDAQSPGRSPMHTDPWAAAGALLPTFIVTFATLVIACEMRGIALFWPADAIVVTLLLQMPVRSWWKGLIAGGFGLVAARMVVGCPLPTALSLSAINLLEILVCVWTFMALTRAQPDLKRPSHLVAFVVSAGGLAPLSSALCAAWYFSRYRHEAFLPDMESWYRGDALGLVVATPLLLMASRLFWRPRAS